MLKLKILTAVVILLLVASLAFAGIKPVACPYDGTTSYWTGRAEKTSGDPRDPGKCEYHHDPPSISVPAHTFWYPCQT